MNIVLAIFILLMLSFNAACALHVLDFYAWWFRKQGRILGTVLISVLSVAVVATTTYAVIVVVLNLIA